MLKRTIRFLALGTASLSGSLLACGAPASGNATATTSAAVSFDVYNASNVKVGSCLGMLIAPDTVITAGHCVAGFSRWEVTAASGQLAEATLGYTYDWHDFNSDISHPLHDDIGLLKLGTQIGLAQYPTLATSGLASGTAVMRARASSTGSTEAVMGAVAYDGTAVGFLHYYYTSVDPTESDETGGAVFDPASNTIYGVVSGRGAVTGNLYVARAELLASWLAPMTTCSSSIPAATTSAFPITVECGDHGTTTGCSGGSSGGKSGSGSGGGSVSGGGSGSMSGSGSGSVSGSSSGSSSSSNGGGFTGPPTPSSSGTSCGGNGGMCQGSSCNGTGGGDTPSTSGSPNGGNSNGGNTSGGSAGGGGSSNSGSGNGGNSSSSNGGNSGGSAGGSGNGGTTNSGSGNGGNSGGTSNSGAGNGGNSGGTSNSGTGNGANSGGTSNSGTGNGGNSGGTSNGGTGNGANSGGTSNSGSGNGDSGSTSGDGPGCTGSTCGGCSGTPGCTDGTEDFGGVPGSSSGTSSPPIQ